MNVVIFFNRREKEIRETVRRATYVNEAVNSMRCRIFLFFFYHTGYNIKPGVVKPNLNIIKLEFSYRMYNKVRKL